MQHRKQISSTIFLPLLFLISGFLFQLAGSYTITQKIFGVLSSDGVFDALTIERYQFLRIALAASGVVPIGLAVVFLRKPQLLSRTTGKITNVIRQLSNDFQETKSTFRTILPKAFWGWILLIAILLVGGFSRGLLLNNSLAYDESYTYINFVRPGIDTIILDYHVPNNHVFHSLLCWISTNLFPVSPISLRLPSFLASIISIFLAYLAGAVISRKSVGFLTAAAMSISPWLIYYGKNARGYSLQIMFTLLLFLAFHFLLHHRNFLVWFSIPLIVALGGWTLPTMLYPTAGLFIWFLISIFFTKKNSAYVTKQQAILYLVIAGLIAIGLTVLLYSPIMIWGTGADSLLNNHFLEKASPDFFLEKTWTVLQQTWLLAFRRVEFLQIPTILGWFFHILLIWRKKKYPVPFSLVMSITIAIMLVIQRTIPYERTWLFLIPLLMLWSIEGWSALLQFICYSLKLDEETALPWSSILSIGLLAFGIYRMTTEYPAELRKIQNIPQTVLYLKETASAENWIIADIPEDMPYMFYHSYYGLQPELLGNNTKTTTIFIIDSTYNQDDYYLKGDVARILTNNGFDPMQADLDNIEIIKTFEEKGNFYSLGTTMVIAVPLLEK